MALDVNKWLVDEMGFTAAEAAAIAPQFSDRADKLEKGYLRQSDYSRQMNDLKKLQTQLEDNNEKLNRDLAEFATMTAGEQSQATALRERIETAEAKAFTLEQKLTRVAEENGLDVKQILGGDPIAKKVDPPKVFDPKPLQDELRTQIGGVAAYMLRLNAKLPGIMREHKTLTGQDLDVDAFIEGIQSDIASGKTENLDPVKRWETLNQIPTKRTDAATAQREADLKAAREEGRLAALSEAALPGAQGIRQGTVSPVFKTSNVTTGSKLQRPQPSQRLSGAISALATGKYSGRSTPA